MTVAPNLRKRLLPGAAVHFTGTTLFDEIARTVCAAECLPRKELYESWEVARRARRRLKGGRVVDLAAGHGLVAYLMLLLDPTSPEAVCVDRRRPLSAQRLADALEARWPRLAGRVRFLEQPLNAVTLSPEDVVVSAHACGGLTDTVLELAMAARAPVAVLPCCHSEGRNDTGGLEGWMDPALAIDATRAGRLRGAGYQVWTQVIPEHVTPKNRLLLGRPTSR